MYNKEYSKKLKSKEWISKRDFIKKRDSFKCTKCENTEKLHVHHKYYIFGNDIWDYPDEALITLCGGCHLLVHASEIIPVYYRNKKTNEIHIEEEHYRYDNNESFGMHRTTEGIDWIFTFTGNELQMLMVLLEIEDLKTGIVSLSPLTREHICSKFKMKSRMLRTIVLELEKKNGLKKLTQSDFILNPQLFYKGGTKVFKAKLRTYLDVNINKNNESN